MVKLISSRNTFPNEELNARGVGESFPSRWANTAEKNLQGIIFCKMGMNEISLWVFYWFSATTEHSIFRKPKENKSTKNVFLVFCLSVQAKQALPEEAEKKYK